MIDFDGAGAVFAGIGFATLAAALLPRLIGKLPISMPIVFLAAGMIVFAVIPDLPDPLPQAHPEAALHLTEVCVIVSLMARVSLSTARWVGTGGPRRGGCWR